VACAVSLDGQAPAFVMTLEVLHCPLPGCQARVYNKTLIKAVRTSERKASMFSGGSCDVSRRSNATFGNGIGSVALSSSKLSGTCAQ